MRIAGLGGGQVQVHLLLRERQESDADATFRSPEARDFLRALEVVPHGDFRTVYTLRIEDLHGIEAKACRQVVIQQADLRHGAHDVRLLQDADAIDGPLGLALDDLDVKAVPAQCDGRGQATNASADDQDTGAGLHSGSSIARLRSMDIRRVVTGHDPQGQAVILSDTFISGRAVPAGDALFAVLWKTVTSPVDNNDGADRAAEPAALTQPQGSILRFVEMQPGARSPMHRTHSLDYGIVLEGQVQLELDNGRTTLLGPGDVVVQRGTIHAWVNPTERPARIAFILLDARPVTVGGKPLPDLHADIRPT